MNILDIWVPLPRSWREAAWKKPGSILLESSRPSLEQHRSLLFLEPKRYLTVQNVEDVPGFFLGVQQALDSGEYLAGYMTYEFGSLLQGLPTHALRAGTCLARLGVYKAPQIFDHLASTNATAKTPLLSKPGPLSLAMLPVIDQGDYFDRIDQVQAWIARGDTYQVNFTTAVQSRYDGSGLDAYERLALEQPCSYGALVRIDEDRIMLSFSPELFFETADTGHITTRPMKGTAPRSGLKEADESAAAALPLDEKNRAEHVMIVDLLRNDLGRICETGSIRVDDLFHVEQYPAVHQMVSTVSGQLRPSLRWREIFTSLFPSGSITGAPKRRTMELIHTLEDRPRDIYTGAIGYIAPTGKSAFSVAIRTVVLQDTARGTVASMGVGGGIVADSVAEEEWKECLLKASFLDRGSVGLKLIETMVAHGDTVLRLPLHLGRLERSARTLGFSVDMRAVGHAILSSMTSRKSSPSKIRVTLSQNGKIEVQNEALQPWPSGLRARIARQRTDRSDPALRYKTTFRQVYDDAFAAAKQDGFHEAIFLNEEGELTEGCVTNLIVSGQQGLRTPALACGVLPGVYREGLLEGGLLREAVLGAGDLAAAEAVFLCNSVRGLVPVRSILLETGESIEFDQAVAEGVGSDIMRAAVK